MPIWLVVKIFKLITVGYDSNTCIEKTSSCTDPDVMGHTTPDLQASGAGSGNGTLTKIK